MKKLNILKSLIDFIWLVGCIPLIPIGLILSIVIFVNDELLQSDLLFDIEEINDNLLYTKLLVLIVIILAYALIYCIYLFRKTLRFFQKRKPFDSVVISNFNKIGYLLVISGVSGGFLVLVFQWYYHTTITLRFGINPTLLIAALGLFFMVLSETFKIAKTAKEENELTI